MQEKLPRMEISGGRHLVLGQSRVRQTLRVLAFWCPRLSRERVFAGSVLYGGLAVLGATQSVGGGPVAGVSRQSQQLGRGQSGAFDQVWHEVLGGRLTNDFPERESVDRSRLVSTLRRRG